jgi:hypothetical protein
MELDDNICRLIINSHWELKGHSHCSSKIGCILVFHEMHMDMEMERIAGGRGRPIRGREGETRNCVNGK